MLSATLTFAMTLAGTLAALSSDYPPDGPSVADVSAWQHVQGDIETTELRVVYALSTSPARPGLYALTRYRLTHKGSPRLGPDANDRTESEKLIWNSQPGSRVPLRCFARAADGSWRTLAPDSPEFKQEMGNAIAVYMLHRRALLEREGSVP